MRPVLIALLASACSAGIAGSPSPGVVYVGDAGTWVDGIYLRGTPCVVELDDGDDYTACCPEGYEPVGQGPMGVACLR